MTEEQEPLLVTNLDSFKEHISVSLVPPNRFRMIGTVSADFLPVGLQGLPSPMWWLARCVVQREHRGKGYGRLLIKTLQETIARERPATVIVSPGGYDLSEEEQWKFYQACGFIPCQRDDEGKVLEWTPTK